MFARIKWMPLISVGVAYAGLVVGLAVNSLVGTPEYEHVTDLHDGLIWLAWSMLAIVALIVSITSLRRSKPPLPSSTVWLAAVLEGLVAIILVVALPFSILSLAAYRNGFTEYDAEVQRCGHPPVLAMVDIVGQKDVVLPTDPDYERLKYSPADFFTLTPTIYYCGLADAEADGYRHFP